MFFVVCDPPEKIPLFSLSCNGCDILLPLNKELVAFCPVPANKSGIAEVPWNELCTVEVGAGNIFCSSFGVTGVLSANMFELCGLKAEDPNSVPNPLVLPVNGKLLLTAIFLPKIPSPSEVIFVVSFAPKIADVP